MSRFNEDFLDILAILSFAIGIANYDENLSQTDMDNMMHMLDQKTNRMLEQLENDLEYQNSLLTTILEKLEEK